MRPEKEPALQTAGRESLLGREKQAAGESRSSENWSQGAGCLCRRLEKEAGGGAAGVLDSAGIGSHLEGFIVEQSAQTPF